MKKLSYILIFIFLASCTSNTIFETPKDLIPKDTMSLLIQDMMIASSAKFIKNKNQQKKINYMPFVNEIYNIDSSRFQNSNYYYMSKIDLYEEILNNAKISLERRKEVFTKLKTALDSIRKDSINKSHKNKLELELELEPIKKTKTLLDSLKINLKKGITPKKDLLKR